jgi:hypothetical protein
MEKGFKARVFEFRAIVTADHSYGISVPLVSYSQDKISNKTKCLPFLYKKEYPCIPRIVVHHNKDVPLSTHRSHMSWANKVNMEQLAWTLSHHIGERRVRRGHHLGMPTRHTNQLFLKSQPWQSSYQIEFTQARQKVKAQVTQLPMPLPQLTRRTSQKATLLLTVYFGTPSMFITLWFGFDYGTNPPLGTLII